MTLDEQITKIEDDLAHFVETDQWLAAAQANQKRIDLQQLKEYICYESNKILSTISDDVGQSDD